MPVLDRCPACGANVRLGQRSCETCSTEFLGRDPDLVRASVRSASRLDNRSWIIELADCTVLGGAGVPFIPGDAVDLRCDRTGLAIQTADAADLELAWSEVTRLGISGPGRVTSARGFNADGLGIEGAGIGKALAAVLTVISTRTSILTIVEIRAGAAEVFLHYGGAEPTALRIMLSRAFAAHRSSAAGGS